MKIDLAILGRQYELHAADYEAAALRALRSAVSSGRRRSFTRKSAACISSRRELTPQSSLWYFSLLP